jgi:ribonuclease BN (tRNA processing enzyme)
LELIKNNGPLNFIGTGSAFNYHLGNNSAYIKRNSSMLLIDCGGTVFHSLVKSNLLQDISSLYVAVTHMHPDHIGSLGDIIFYTYYSLQFKTRLIYPDLPSLKALLDAMGVTEDFYEFLPINNISGVKVNDITVKYLVQNHTDTLKSFAYILELDNRKIYYSGDAKTIPDTILQQLYSNEIDYLYQDTCSYEGNDIPHLSLNKLSQSIPTDLRHKVYCMHLDEAFDIKEAQSLGFKIAVNCPNTGL